MRKWCSYRWTGKKETIRMQNNFDFSQPQSHASDRLSDAVIEWLGRTHDTMEEWKAKARGIFHASNGDSNTARNRVASIVRSYFLTSPPEDEDVNLWNEGHTRIEPVHVTPPKVSASNAAFVDWLFVADYLLLASASLSEELAEENQRRETEFRQVLDSYRIRLIIYDAREEMRRGPDLTDDGVVDSVKSKYPKASMSHIKEARRLEKANTRHGPPKEPPPSVPMPRYTALYF